jgi:hypothetical protein
MRRRNNKTENGTAHQITQHIRCGLTPLPFGTLLPSVATSYMLGTLGERVLEKRIKAKSCCINRSGRDILYNKPRGKDR